MDQSIDYPEVWKKKFHTDFSSFDIEQMRGTPDAGVLGKKEDLISEWSKHLAIPA
jgi:hypothetical protein